MTSVKPNRGIDFFDAQFRKQVAGGDFALNPFEKLALPYLRGRVLDYGCGLGNLAIEAARWGLAVTAGDASPAAIARSRRAAGAGRPPSSSVPPSTSAGAPAPRRRTIPIEWRARMPEPSPAAKRKMARVRPAPRRVVAASTRRCLEESTRR